MSRLFPVGSAAAGLHWVEITSVDAYCKEGSAAEPLPLPFVQMQDLLMVVEEEKHEEPEGGRHLQRERSTASSQLIARG